MYPSIHVSKISMISKYPLIQLSKKNQYPRYPSIRISEKSGIRPSLPPPFNSANNRRVSTTQSRTLTCVSIIQSAWSFKLHNRNEIEPHWAPGPSFPGFGSNTVRFPWPRVTGQVHLGHHSLYPQFCQRPQSRHYSTIGYAEHLSYNSMIIIE